MTTPPLSPSTIALFDELLARTQLLAGAPDFEQRAQQIIIAKQEIDALRVETE